MLSDVIENLYYDFKIKLYYAKIIDYYSKNWVI